MSGSNVIPLRPSAASAETSGGDPDPRRLLNGVNSAEVDRLVYGSPHQRADKAAWWPGITTLQRAGLVRVAISGDRRNLVASIHWTDAGLAALARLRAGAS